MNNKRGANGKTRRKNLQRPPKPNLFSESIYKSLKNHIYTNPKIMLTMSNYNACEINPLHPKNEAYSHVILVCIKFMKTEIYQPIGSLMYQRARLIESVPAFVKMLSIYVETLNNLGYVVVGSISSSDKIFLRTFQYLCDVSSKSVKNHKLGLLTYELASTKLVHIFDFKDLYVKFMEKWKCNDLFGCTGNDVKAPWSYIHPAILSAQRYYLDDDFLESFFNLDIVLNIAVIKILEKQLIDGLIPTEAESSFQILALMTNIFIIISETAFVKMENSNIENLLMFYVITLRVLYFKKKKSPLLEVKPTENMSENTNATTATRRVELLANYFAYIKVFMQCNLYGNNYLHTKLFDFCSPSNLFARIDSMVNKDKITENNSLVVLLINTIIGFLEILQSFKKSEVNTLNKNCFNIEHVDYFVYFVKTVKNNVENSVYQGRRPYPALDLEAAYKIFNREDGALMVSY